LALFYFPT